jgi:excisionase family DNA binding protein
VHATASLSQEKQNDEAPLGRSINAAAIRAGVGRSTIYAAINTGALKAHKAGRRTIIIETDLRTWLASLPLYVGAQS